MQQVLSISSLGEMLSQERTPDHTGVKIREKITMIINSNNLDAFRNDFKKAMADLQEKYDVTISLGNITFEEERFSAKVTVVNGQDPEQVERNNFDADVWRYSHLGLQPGMYHRIFRGTDNQLYAIRGFNTKAKKHPIKILRISDSTRRICGESFIKEFFNEYYVESIVPAD